MIVNRPIPFDGTPEQKAANYRSHAWHTCGDPEDGDVHCADCDAKPWHKAASYPCGVDVPRETVEV